VQTLDLRQRERGKSLRQGQTVTPWGIQRAACTSFSLSNPDPSLKSNTTLQSLSLSMSTGVLSPETSLNMGVGERNSGGTGPERALNRFIQSASDNKLNNCLLREGNSFLNHGRLVAPVPRHAVGWQCQPRRRLPAAALSVEASAAAARQTHPPPPAYCWCCYGSGAIITRVPVLFRGR
jgi:hypothetical protein